MAFLHMTMQIASISKIFLAVFALLSWNTCVHVHVLLQILPVSKCFLANITFVLLQIFFMAFDHMCFQIIRSAKSLGTYLTCDHTVCMNLLMPCNVSFLEHFSTFVTFYLLMPLLCWFNLDLDRNVFPHSAHAESNMVLTR